MPTAGQKIEAILTYLAQGGELTARIVSRFFRYARYVHEGQPTSRNGIRALQNADQNGRRIARDRVDRVIEAIDQHRGGPERE